MTSRRATPAPVAPPNSNQARIELQQNDLYSPGYSPRNETNSEPSPNTSKLSFVYRRSSSPSINVQICKRTISPGKRIGQDSPGSLSQPSTPPSQFTNRALFASPVQHSPTTVDQQQSSHSMPRRQLYHVITPDAKSTPPHLSETTPSYGTLRRVSPAPVAPRDTPIRLNCGQMSPSRIPIIVSTENSARIRQRIIIAPENAPPPSGLSQVTRANLAANLTSAAARRRSLSSRSSSRSSLSEDIKETSPVISSKNKSVTMTLPIRRVSVGFTGSHPGSPVNDARYQEVAPPERFWKNRSSSVSSSYISSVDSSSSPATPTGRLGAIPTSLAIAESYSSNSSNSSRSATPNKLRGLRYDTIPLRHSGPSPAERKLEELTTAIEKDLELNIPLQQSNLKSSKVSRYISNGSLNSLSDKSSSSQTSPSSRSDESLVPFPEHISSISQVLSQRSDSDQDYYGECNTCGEGVYGEDNACEAMENIYHVKCFTCDECGRTLRDKAFYSVNGNIYCEEDYKYSGFQQNNENCASCGHLIMDMQVLQAHNKSYHPSCFRCKACNVPLQSNPFITDKSNRVYCVKDYYRLHSPVCNYCRRTIDPLRDSNETVKVVSRNRDYHVDCFHCHDCNLQLTSEEDKICYPNSDGSRLYCKNCSLEHKEVCIDVNPDDSCQLVISTNVPPESPGAVLKVTNL